MHFCSSSAYRADTDSCNSHGRHVRLSVRPSVRPSVTRWYCIKTTQARTTQSSLMGCPGTLSFC